MAIGKKCNFLREEDEKRIVSKIAALEKKTSAEVRVHITKTTNNALADAKYTFSKLKMHKTHFRNGVLLFIAMESKKAAIYGDLNIHAIIQDNGWSDIIQKMTGLFKSGEYSQGILEALNQIEVVLAKHFPASSSEENPNELSNEISTDE